MSDLSFFVFLERYVGHRDPLLSETRKQLYYVIAKYIKVRIKYVVEYLDIIYVPNYL